MFEFFKVVGRLTIYLVILTSIYEVITKPEKENEL